MGVEDIRNGCCQAPQDGFSQCSVLEDNIKDAKKVLFGNDDETEEYVNVEAILAAHVMHMDVRKMLLEQYPEDANGHAPFNVGGVDVTLSNGVLTWDYTKTDTLLGFLQVILSRSKF
jgi:hypothetical protein